MKFNKHDKTLLIVTILVGISFWYVSNLRAKCGFFNAECHNYIFLYEIIGWIFFGLIVSFGLKKVLKI